MTDRAATGDAGEASKDDELDPWLRDPRTRAWLEEHSREVRRAASGQHFLYWGLAIGFAVGLAAHIAGYALRTSSTDEPLGLIADLLYASGLALWTGVVVVVFVHVIPEAKRRQITRALDAFETARRAEARSDDAVSPPGA
jgi:hypothetical protein